MDIIFTAIQMQEKYYEQTMDLAQVFIDITKTFDTVNRTVLCKMSDIDLLALSLICADFLLLEKSSGVG